MINKVPNYRKLLIITIIIALMGGFYCKVIHSNNDTEEINELVPIYSILLDKEFDTAKLDGDKIVLYAEGETVGECQIEEMPSTKILYIENRDTNIIFWQSGFDDLEGIMFMKSDWTDDTWNGFARVEKIQGNAYKVYTYR